jgi:L-fuculose-phosphate aldolase
MTPKGNDKGALQRDEIAYRKGGQKEWSGNFPPSSEWPFHTRIYQERSDVRAVLHAHSQTLVAFSVANQLPNAYSLSQTAFLCGSVGLAPYAMPGTDALADSIVEQIKTHDCVIMANHGVVVVGVTMMECYQKFEALEFCARAQVRARVLGGETLLLTPQDMTAQAQALSVITEGAMRPLVTPTECDLRASLVKFVRRSYDQGLVHSTSGAMSCRLTPTSFLITPSGVDRRSIQPEDIVLIEFPSMAQAKLGQGAHFYGDPGHVPSRAWAVHNALYQAFPDTHAVFQCHPFHISAFCMTSVNFSSKIIPESYIVLRTVGRIPFRQSLGPDVVDGFRDNSPCNVLLVNNDGVIVKGSTLPQVFDRLEVLEATANVVLECKSLGALHPMTREQTEEIDEKWFHEKPNSNKRQKHELHERAELYGKW